MVLTAVYGSLAPFALLMMTHKKEIVSMGVSVQQITGASNRSEW